MSRDVAVWVLLVAFVALVGALVYLACLHIARQRRRFLYAHSTAMHAIRDINARYEGCFFDYQDSYLYRADLSSKQKFDRFDAEGYLFAIVRETLPTWEDVLRRAASNTANYDAYCAECDRALSRSATPRQVPWYFGSRKRYRRFECAQFRSQVLHPKHGLDVRVAWSYTSPAGRNNYADAQDFGLPEVAGLVGAGHDRRAYEASAKYQRGLVTPKVRFEVFRRDGYRCQICGRTQAEGAKLVVDHIVPVAKGGTSDMDNLQTLCFECNSGKSDRFM